MPIREILHSLRTFPRFLRFKAFLGALAFLLAISQFAFAQLPTGTILGVIKDASGAAAPGTTIKIRSTETNIERTVSSGEDGSYRVPALPVGHYDISAEHSGFKTETQQNLVLDVGQEAVVNFTLQVGTTEQQVVVTGEAPLVNTTSGSLGNLVNEQKVSDLPLNGRNWVDLTLMQPGIEQHKNIGGASPVAAAGTFYSSNGATIRSNNYLLDGAPMVTIYGATQSSVDGSTLGVDGIREYRVVTNSFGAEYGLTMGSQTTLVTKSGANQFHGDVFEYMRNSVLDARNYFDAVDTGNVNGLGSDKSLVYPGKRLPPFIRNNFGASAGGPIKKDNTFFYATYEGVRQRKGLTLIGTGISAAARASANINPVIKPLLSLWPLPSPGLPNNEFTYPFIAPTNEDYGQIRLDHTFSAKDTAFVRYTIDRSSVAQSTIAAPNPNLVDHLFSESQFTSVSETHIFTPDLLMTARFSLSRTPLEDLSPTPDYTPPGGGAPVSFIPGFPQFGMGVITVGGISPFSPGLQVHHDQKIYVYSDDIFYTRGRHSLKFGALITHWRQQMDLESQLRGGMTFSNLSNFLQGIYVNYTGNTPGSDVVRNYTSNTVGFYGQDDFRVNSRLTLNLGLRYEFMTGYNEINNLSGALRNPLTDAAITLGPPVRNPSLLDFSPRLGFAWDVRGNGQTSIRSGFGILYDVGNLGAALIQAAVGTPPTSSISTVTGGVPLTIPFTFPASALAKSLNTVQYRIGQPFLYSYNLTVEQQLPFGVAVSAGYVGSRGVHIMNREEANNCIPTGTTNGVFDWANATNKSCPLGRFNPNWQSITAICSCSASWYNGLQVVATKRVSHGLQFQGNFTWSKLLDEGNAQQVLDNSWVTNDPLQPALQKGPAGFDVSKNFRFNAIYNFPKVSANGFVAGLANGWWTSTIISYQTGYPYTPVLNTNRSLSGVLGAGAAIDTPDIRPGRTLDSIEHGVSTCAVGSLPAGTPLHTPQLWFDPCGFTTQPAGFLGNVGRNIIRGPGLSNVDFSIVKDTPVKYFGEGGQVEFRTEVFNLFNHPNFLLPSAAATVLPGTGATQAAADTPLATAGVINTTGILTSRQIQLALKVIF